MPRSHLSQSVLSSPQLWLGDSNYCTGESIQLALVQNVVPWDQETPLWHQVPWSGEGSAFCDHCVAWTRTFRPISSSWIRALIFFVENLTGPSSSRHSPRLRMVIWFVPCLQVGHQHHFRQTFGFAHIKWEERKEGKKEEGKGGSEGGREEERDCFD